jgi:hypothetical protein
VIVSPQLGLNVLGALHGVNDGGEVHQECVAHSLDNHTVMCNDRPVDNLIVNIQQP